jgi:thymidine kinase
LSSASSGTVCDTCGEESEKCYRCTNDDCARGDLVEKGGHER